MTHDIMLQIIAVATLATSSIGIVMVIAGKVVQQALLFLLPAFIIGLTLMAMVYVNSINRRKGSGK